MNIAEHITSNAQTPLNILILNWRFPSDKEAGGAEVHLASMMEDLISLGHSVTLVASRPRFGHREGVERVEQVREIEAGRWFSAHFAIPRAARRLLKEESFDLVVDDVNKIPFEAPRWSSVPVVAVFHHLLGHTLSIESNAAVAVYIGNKEKRIGAVYQGTPAVAVSNQTKFELTELGLKKSDIEVIPPTTPDTKPLRNVRRTKEPTILVLSRLRAYKRVDFAIDVFREIAEEHPTARLIIAGEGPEETKLKKQAEDLSERIEFMGYVSNEEKRTLLHECWIGLCPSEKEGWGIVPREMLDSGMTVLASDVAGHRESVKGEKGTLLPIESKSSWEIRLSDECRGLRASEFAGCPSEGQFDRETNSCLKSLSSSLPLARGAVFTLLLLAFFALGAIGTQAQAPFGPRDFPNALDDNVGWEVYDYQNSGNADPVHPQNGEFGFTVSDLVVRTDGFPIAFQRTYRSNLVYKGPLGHRSDFNYNIALVEPTATTIVSYPGFGKGINFTKNPSDQIYYPDSAGINETISLVGTQLWRKVGGSTFKYESPTTGKWRLVTVTDLRGRSLTLKYDSTLIGGKLTEVKNEKGDGIEIDYHSSGFISHVSDLKNTAIVVDYDFTSGDELETVTAMPGTAYEQKFSYTYDGNSQHRIITVTNPAGNAQTPTKPKLRNYYDTQGRVIYQEYGTNVSDGSSTPPANPAYSIVYGTSNVVFKDREGREFQYTYDANDNLTTQVKVSASGNLTSTFEYDSFNNLTKHVREDGSSVNFTYDTGNSDFRRRKDMLTRTVKDASGSNPVTATWAYNQDGYGVSQITHDSGRIDTFEYDAIGNNTKKTKDINGLAAVTVYEFDGAAEFYRMKSVSSDGFKTGYEYDDSGYLTRVVIDQSVGGANIAAKTYAYDSLGRLTKTTDALGLSTINELDAVGRTVRRTYDVTGSPETEFYYDVAGKMTKSRVRTAAGSPGSWRTIESTFDLVGRPVRSQAHVDAAGTVLRGTTNEYDDSGALTKVVGDDGTAIKYFYDDLGRNTKVERSGSSTTLSDEYEYDSLNRITKFIPAGATSRSEVFEFDHVGFRTKVTYPDGLEVEKTFEGNKVTAVDSGDGTSTDPLSRTEFQYDSLGQLTKSRIRYRETPSGSDIGDGWLTTEMTYDSRGQLSTQKDDAGIVTSFEYDNFGQLTETSNANGDKITRTFNDLGQLLTESMVRVGPSSSSIIQTTSYEYDELHRLTKTTDPVGGVTTQKFNISGEVTEITSSTGSKTVFEYDFIGRTTKTTTDVAASSTSSSTTEYDLNGRITKSIDPIGAETTFAYDDLHRQTKTTFDDGTTVEIVYDANGRLATKIDQNSTKVIFHYTPGGLITKKTFVATASHIKGETTAQNYRYDLLGRLTKAADTDSRVLRTYDTRGALLTEEMQYGLQNKANQSGKTVESVYDVHGRLSLLKLPDSTSTNGWLRYSYDDVNRATKLERVENSSWSDYETVTWLGPDLPYRRVQGNGVATDYGYDSAGLLTKLHSFRDLSPPAVDTSVLECNYRYDSVGRLTGEATKHFKNDGTLLDDSGFVFAFDLANRLTKYHDGVSTANIGAGLPTAYTIKHDIDLDDSSNRLGVDHTPFGGTAVEDDYEVNDLGDYTRVTFGGEVVDYTYDSAGNRKSVTDMGRTWEFDPANRVVTVLESSAEWARYQYDALGRRTRKRWLYDGASSNETWRHYNYGGMTVQEYKVTTSQGVESEALETEYIPGILGLAGMRTDIQSSEVAGHFHADGMGSIASITESTSVASVLEHYRYDPFGCPSVFDGDTVNAPSQLLGNSYLHGGQFYDFELTNIASGVSLFANGNDPEIDRGIHSNRNGGGASAGQTAEALGIAPEIGAQGGGGGNQASAGAAPRFVHEDGGGGKKPNLTAETHGLPSYNRSGWWEEEWGQKVEVSILVVYSCGDFVTQEQGRRRIPYRKRRRWIEREIVVYPDGSWEMTEWRDDWQSDSGFGVPPGGAGGGDGGGNGGGGGEDIPGVTTDYSSLNEGPGTVTHSSDHNQRVDREFRDRRKFREGLEQKWLKLKTESVSEAWANALYEHHGVTYWSDERLLEEIAHAEDFAKRKAAGFPGEIYTGSKTFDGPSGRDAAAHDIAVFAATAGIMIAPFVAWGAITRIPRLIALASEKYIEITMGTSAGSTQFERIQRGAYTLASGVYKKLQDPRLGSLSGRLSTATLKRLVQNRNAARYFDTVTGNINVVQRVGSKLLRITKLATENRIISVGPIRANGIANGVARGRFIRID